MLSPWKKSYDQPREHIKKRDITFPTKVHLVKLWFSNSHIWMWELDYKESWVLKNWCFWTVVLEETLESPLDSEEVQLIHLEGNQSWIFIGRTDAEAEASIFGHLMGRSDSLEKSLMLGKIKGRRRRGHHEMRWLDGITNAKNMNLGKFRR